MSVDILYRFFKTKKEAAFHENPLKLLWNMIQNNQKITTTLSFRKMLSFLNINILEDSSCFNKKINIFFILSLIHFMHGTRYILNNFVPIIYENEFVRHYYVFFI